MPAVSALPDSLLKLLRDLYTRDEFTSLVAHDEMLREIQHELPGPAESTNEFFTSAIQQVLMRRLFDDLHRAVLGTRPKHVEKINAVFRSLVAGEADERQMRQGAPKMSLTPSGIASTESELADEVGESASAVLLGERGPLRAFFMHTASPWAIVGLDTLVLPVGPTGAPGELARRYLATVPLSVTERISDAARIDGPVGPERPQLVTFTPDIPGPRSVFLASAYLHNTDRATLDGVQTAATSAFGEAKRRGLRRIAFPLLGTGGGGLNDRRVDVARRIIVAALAVLAGESLELYIVDQNPFSDEELAELRSVEATAAEVMTLGTGLEIQREASEKEGALDVAKYVEALTTLFTRAGKDFTFALFGPWGRGKTYLMNRTAKALREQHQYETVHFSAWAYPQTPVLWAHLYECVAERALSGSWPRRLGRSLRAALARRGPDGGIGGMFVALLGFGLGVLPFGVWFSVGKGAYTLFGLAGLFMIVRVARRGSELGRRLRNYLMLPRHDEQLGLQVVIGRDLKALLVGWIPDGPPVTRTQANLYFVLCLGVFAALFPWTYVEGSGTWWLGAVLAVAWLIVASALGGWTLYAGGSPRRVLLVVDDLDRCEPARMLEVIENLRLFIETQGVGERMHVAMLVDESVLELALLTKYRAYGALPGTSRQLLEESVEKLFLAYLRLPPLTGDDLVDVADKYFGELRRQHGAVSAATAFASATATAVVTPPRAGVVEAVVMTREALAPLFGSPVVEAVAAVAGAMVGVRRPAESRAPERERSRVDAFSFTSEEEQALRQELRTLVEERGGRVGPRTVRSILFRYQLARLLLERMGHRLGAAELAAALVGAHGNSTGFAKDGLAYRIVCQVCLSPEVEVVGRANAAEVGH